MGADAIAMSRSRWLWKRLGHPYWFSVPYRGASYRAMAEEMEEYLNKEITDVPTIQGNIFFQYKRSDYMVANSAAEWTHWNQSYYRYDIYPEQHHLLERLHQSFGSDVLILYAAPAVRDVNELVDMHKTSTIIANTNFCPAHTLSKHHRNTFTTPGSYSWACSEPVRLEAFSFEEALARFKIERTEPIEIVIAISKKVDQIMLESTYRKSYETLKKMYGTDELSERTPLMKAYLSMVCLREITGIQWVIVRPRNS